MTSTSTQGYTQGRVLDKASVITLPPEATRVDGDCPHSPLYIVQLPETGIATCGLCFFREGWESELPTTVHQHHVLAQNGNPETAPKFMAHLFLVMGLVQPEEGMDLKEWRRIRKRPLAREQYTDVAWGLFPIGSSLWQLMGYQPPLGIVLVRAVSGFNELQIAKELELSTWNVVDRMAKAIRTALRYIPKAKLVADDGL